jgi:HAD superfamily hydrolase (TIGR01549 family)
MKKISAILFDMIGTTVLERDSTVITSCFEQAFAQHSVKIDREQIRNVRGMDKFEAIGLILQGRNNLPELRFQIFESFKSNVQKNISNFQEHPQLREVMVQLRERNVLIGIASGLPTVLFEMLYEKFNWTKYSFDYIGVYENFPKGRPDPTLIFDMCKKLNNDVGRLLKVGDTVADIEEGKNANSKTAAVVAGTQPELMLRQANPDFILKSLGDVVDIVK